MANGFGDEKFRVEGVTAQGENIPAINLAHNCLITIPHIPNNEMDKNALWRKFHNLSQSGLIRVICGE